MRTAERKLEPWFEDLRDEFNHALVVTDCFSEGKPDRTDLMRSIKRANETISVREIISAVANTGDMAFFDITGSRCRAKHSLARALVSYLATELRPDLNGEQIARAMGREKSIVCLGNKRAESLLTTDNNFMHWYARARKWLGLA